MRYVVTNPDKETKLKEDDIVFVLAKQEPGDPDKWDDFSQISKGTFDSNQNRLVSNINNMMLKKSKPAKKGAKKGKEEEFKEKESKNHYYSTMTNQANNQIPPEDGEVELKPDIHQTIGSKKLQEEFENTLKDLTTRVISLND